jgi:hypothetical protein
MTSRGWKGGWEGIELLGSVSSENKVMEDYYCGITYPGCCGFNGQKFVAVTSSQVSTSFTTTEKSTM